MLSGSSSTIHRGTSEHDNAHLVKTFLFDLENVPLYAAELHGWAAIPLKAVSPVWIQPKLLCSDSACFTYEDNLVASCRDAEHEGLEKITSLLEDLLRTRRHVFWTHLLFDPGLQTFLVTFLQHYHRNFEVSTELRYRQYLFQQDDDAFPLHRNASHVEDEPSPERLVTLVLHHERLVRLFRAVVGVLQRALCPVAVPSLRTDDNGCASALPHFSSAPFACPIHQVWLQVSLFRSVTTAPSEDLLQFFQNPTGAILPPATKPEVLLRFLDLCSLIPASLFKESLITLGCDLLAIFPDLVTLVSTKVLPTLTATIKSCCRRLVEALAACTKDDGPLLLDYHENHVAVATLRQLDILETGLEAIGTLDGLLAILLRTHTPITNEEAWVCALQGLMTASHIDEQPQSQAAAYEALRFPKASLDEGDDNTRLQGTVFEAMSMVCRAYKILIRESLHPETSEAVTLGFTRFRRSLLSCVLSYVCLPLQRDGLRYSYVFEHMLEWSLSFVQLCEHEAETATMTSASSSSSTNARQRAALSQQDIADTLGTDFRLVGGCWIMTELQESKVLSTEDVSFLLNVWHCTTRTDDPAVAMNPISEVASATSIAAAQCILFADQKSRTSHEQLAVCPLSSQNVTPEELSCVEAIQDIVRCLELGDGFILSCLRYYGGNADRVVDALLTSQLPKELTGLDQKLPLPSRTSETPQIEANLPSAAFDFSLKSTSPVPDDLVPNPSDSVLKEKVLVLERQQRVAAARDAMRAGQVPQRDPDVIAAIPALALDSDEHSDGSHERPDTPSFMATGDAKLDTLETTPALMEDEPDDTLDQWISLDAPGGGSEEDVAPALETQWGRRRLKGGRWEDDPHLHRRGPNDPKQVIEGGTREARRKEAHKAQTANHFRRDRRIRKLNRGL